MAARNPSKWAHPNRSQTQTRRTGSSDGLSGSAHAERVIPRNPTIPGELRDRSVHAGAEQLRRTAIRKKIAKAEKVTFEEFAAELRRMRGR